MKTGTYAMRVALAPLLSLLLRIVWRLDPELAALYRFALAAFLIPAWLCWMTGSYMLSGPGLRMAAGVVPPLVSFLCLHLCYGSWRPDEARGADWAGLLVYGTALLAAGLIAAAGTLIALLAKLAADRRKREQEDCDAYS